MRNFIAIAAALVLFSSSVAPCDAAPKENDFKMEVVPYLWFPGIDADVTAGDRTADVDIDYDDLDEALDSSGSLLTVIQYKQLVLWGQIDYFAFDTDEANDSPTRSRFENESLFATGAVGMQFRTFGEQSTIDVLGGVRYFEMENTVTEGASSTEAKDELLDGIFMLRPNFQLLSWLRFNPTMSIGAGDSDLTYELQPQFHFQFTEHLVARLGYRRLYYDVQGERVGFDGTFHGPIAGLGASF